MIRQAIAVINDFSGGQDTKTPIISMGLNKSPNMRNWHCAGVKERLMRRGGFAKVNSSTIETDNLDVSYPPGYQTYDYPLRTTAAYTQISQGFKCATSSTVTKVRLWLKKVGTPAGTDTVTLEIQSDSSGVPSGNEVTNGVATAVDISDTITTSYAWVTFTFATNPTLVAGTQYHLVLSGAFTLSETNYVIWGADNYDVIYPDGSMSVYDGTTWVTDSNYDACFEVYITGGAKGNDGVAVYDFSSKNMLLGVFGTSLYRMDKNSAGTPDGTWDALSGGTNWDTYTKLVSNFDGSDAATAFTDPVAGAYTFAGTAQLDTAQKKFGTASLLLDGDSDYITLPDSNDWDFGSGNFTIDLQVRFVSVASECAFVTQGAAAIESFGLSFTPFGAGGPSLWFYYSQTTLKTISKNWSPSINTWYHVEVVRTGDIMRMFIDGTQIGEDTAITGAIDSSDSVLTVGRWTTTNPYYMNGWIDELRISKGIARHTANFTAPTAAYSASVLSLTSSRFWTFADWQSGRALINTDIGLYYYTGSGDITAVTGSPPIGKFMTIWRNFVFIAGIRASPNTVRYSDVSTYTTWTAGNTLNFDTNDGDVITGIRILKGKLFIFKRYSVHRVSYLGSNPTFQVDPILGIGSPSHYCIKEVDMGGDLGTVLVFLTTDKKLAIFDGYNIQVLSDSLSEESNDLFASADDQPLSFADMNFKYIDLFHAVVKQDTYEYILYCVLGNDTSVNYAFVLDYKTGGIYPYDNQVFASSCYAMSTSKSKLLYCAGYTGYIWQMESGNSDDGTAINAYWVSGKIKPALVSLAVKALQLGLNYKEITSASTINLSLQYRIDWNVSWTTAETHSYNHNDELTFGKTSLSDVGTVENMLQLKISNNSSDPAPTLYGIDLYGTQLGVDVGEKAVT